MKITIKSGPSATTFIEHCLANGQHLTNLSDDAIQIRHYLLPQLAKLNSPHHLWTNIHFVGVDGRIYRLRQMVDDGEDGEYQKLILLVEDEDGFPTIHPLPQGINPINTSPLDIAKLLGDASIIHREEAVSYQGESEESDLFVERVNGEIVRAEFSQRGITLRCGSS